MNRFDGSALPAHAPSAISLDAHMAGLDAIPGNPVLARARAAYGLGVDVATSAPAIDAPPNSGAAYPAGSLSLRLRLAARSSARRSAPGSSRSIGERSTPTAPSF